MNFIWSSAEISKTPSYRQLLHWWHYAVTETVLPNFKLGDLGTSPFYYGINITRSARSERGKRDIQYSQVGRLSGLYWTRYSYSKTQKLLRNISDVRKVCAAIHVSFGKFSSFQIVVSCSILAPLTPILRFFLTAMCSLLLCGFVLFIP